MLMQSSHRYEFEHAGFSDQPKPPGDTALGSSQSVTKLETWMRFANLHYTRGVSNPADAPKGQVRVKACT